MSKLRRIAEVGDGSYEQMMQKNASVADESELQSATRRKKKYASVSEQVIPKQNNWEELKGALKVSQKQFDPEDFSSYDTSGRSVRRYESDEIEYETPYDTTSAYNPYHMYSDPMAELEEVLKEAALGDAKSKEYTLAKDLRALENTGEWNREANAWAQARLRGRNGEVKSANSIRGGITKTANEEVSDSKFGQLDYNSMNTREMERLAREEQMYQRHRSIKDSRIDITKEQRQAQWANEENIRSSSVQNKMKGSQLFNKLAQLKNN